MGQVTLNNITKRFGDFVAVNDVSIEIQDGELLALLGPSGCGKTTTLRCIAGLEFPSEGRIYIGDEDVTEIDPRHRNIAMVFQDLALYPHKSVRNNMAFPLQMQGMKKSDIDRRIQSTTEILEIEELIDRSTVELSGGQQQRVALGRAIVRDPDVFLMDEPLSSLDAKLRTSMRAEILELHQELDATLVYVTHDQEIAMTLGDRIAIMNEGHLQQIADPQTVYKRPANEFVARFIGSPDMNFFDAEVAVNGDSVELHTDQFNIGVHSAVDIGEWKDFDGQRLRFGLRPQDIYDPAFIVRPFEQTELVNGEVTIIEELGSISDVHIVVDDKELIARIDGDTTIDMGQTVDIVFDTTKLHAFDIETGDRVTQLDRTAENEEVVDRDRPDAPQNTSETRE